MSTIGKSREFYENHFENKSFTDRMNASNHPYVVIDYYYYMHSTIDRYYSVEPTEHQMMGLFQEEFPVLYHYVLI